MRPGADTRSSHATTRAGQGAVGSQSIPAHVLATVLPSAAQVSQRRPVIVRRGMVSSTCVTCAARETGSDGAVDVRRRSSELLERGGEGAEPWMVVDVGDGDLGVRRTQLRHELRRREAAAAEVEEVVVGAGRRRAEDVGPDALQLPLGAVELHGLVGVDGGQRPREGVAVDLARGARGQRVDDREARHQRGRHRGAQGRDRGRRVELVGDGEVADEQRVARAAAAYGGSGTRDPRQGEQRAVDLAELDAAPADLHLVVRAAEEEQPLLLVADEVAAAVGAVPAEGGHRGVLLGVLLRVEVPREPDAADDQLAAGARLDLVPALVDDGEVPAVEREADPHRRLARELRAARDDRRLGGAVGVPDLAAVLDEPCGELGRAGLAAEDEQAYGGQRLGRPESDERRHGRDDGEVVRDEPRAELHAAAHERSRRRDEAGAVPPGEPHLLARRVERDRQPRHHAVAGAERLALQEQVGLGVDEGRGAAVRDRDALGGTGRAGGEDDPGVVGDGRDGAVGDRRLRTSHGQLEVVGDHCGDRGLAEDRPRPLVRVVGVDGHVRRSGDQCSGDRDVQVGRAGADADADLVARADSCCVQLLGDLLGRVEELLVRQHLRAVVDRGLVRVVRGGAPQDVHEGPRRRRQRTAEEAHACSLPDGTLVSTQCVGSAVSIGRLR